MSFGARGKYLAYNDPRVSGKSAVYGLIGDPVDHTMSPTIQNAAFRSAGLNAVYVPFRVEGPGLRLAVQGLRALGVRGFNITAPHKISILRFIDEVETKAAQIGSINTVTNDQGLLTGFDTDGPGALNALREAGVSPNGKAVLLFGAGGAGRAIAYALAEHDCAITLVNRTISRAKRLAKSLHRSFGISSHYHPLAGRDLHDFVNRADVIVNASSMGMGGANNIPIGRRCLRADHCVFDIVYKPVQTKLLRNAAHAGAKTINGLDMLVNQGACSFELWTGRKAPILEMRHAIDQKLSGIEHASLS